MTRAPLVAADISDEQIERRLRIGALQGVHRGTYRVGHRAPGTDATYMAAVLACGEGALPGGLAAGHLLGVLRRRPEVPSTELITLLPRLS